MKANSRKTVGFTLVEVVVSMFLATIIISAALTSVMAVSWQMEVSRSRIVATTVLTQKTEELKIPSFATLKTNLESASYLTGTESINQRQYNWIRTVVPLDQTESTGLLLIRTNVTWKVRNRVYQATSLSYISKYGVSTKSLM